MADPDYLIYQHEVTIIDKDQIKNFNNHAQFSELSVEIFKEVTNLILSISSITRSKDNQVFPFNREEAALIGNLVRYTKISMAYLEQYVKKRSEICFILFRSLTETYINLKYFLKFKDEHTLNHYIKHSLKQEKKLLDFVRENGSKNPEYSHIESRMMDSIQRSFKASGFSEEEISNSSKWEDKVKKRLDEIISPSIYLLYGNSSHAVHGNWQDLITHHLNKEGNGFIPNIDWTEPTIQLLAPVTLMSCDLIRNYATEILPDSKSKDVFINRIEDIFVRAYDLDKLHEEFIQKNHDDIK